MTLNVGDCRSLLIITLSPGGNSSPDAILASTFPQNDSGRVATVLNLPDSCTYSRVGMIAVAKADPTEKVKELLKDPFLLILTLAVHREVEKLTETFFEASFLHE